MTCVCFPAFNGSNVFMKTPTTVIRGKHVEIRAASLFSIEVIWWGLRTFFKSKYHHLYFRANDVKTH